MQLEIEGSIMMTLSVITILDMNDGRENYHVTGVHHPLIESSPDNDVTG